MSFYTADDNVTYYVRIFDKFENGQLLDEIASKTGNIYFSGFHTIDLDNEVNISKDDDFYVYVEFSNGGHAYDCTSEVPVLLGSSSKVQVQSSSKPGQSFYYDINQWVDLYDLDNTANFCIKALTTINNSGFFGYKADINFISPNPFRDITIINYSIPERTNVVIEIFDMEGKKIATLLDGIIESGNHDISWNGNNNIGLKVNNGIYYCRLKTSINICTKAIIFMGY